MKEKECQYDRIYEKTIDFDRPQFVKELQMQINDNKKKDKEIERLTAESTEWESKYYDLQERFDNLMEAHKICDVDNERLNNIIDELESYLEQQYLEWKDCETDVKFMAHEDKAILDKLKELKEGK